jgi:hypothetical protein
LVVELVADVDPAPLKNLQDDENDDREHHERHEDDQRADAPATRRRLAPADDGDVGPLLDQDISGLRPIRAPTGRPDGMGAMPVIARLRVEANQLGVDTSGLRTRAGTRRAAAGNDRP